MLEAGKFRATGPSAALPGGGLRRAPAALLLLVAALALFLFGDGGVGQAQATQTLVSNTGQGSDSDYTSTSTRGQAFTSGYNPRSATAPTAMDSTVMATEDMRYVFTAADFKFSATTGGDTLTSVQILTLPALGRFRISAPGSSVNVTVNETVSKAALDSGYLTYNPPANGYGSGYASFTFKVIGNTETSDVAYSMTVDVTGVNDPPTGVPTISGTPEGRRTLTVSTTDVADVDGLTSVVFAYQWKRYAADGSTFERHIGTNSTYTLTEGDVGKKVVLKLAFDDDGGGSERLFSAAFPPTGTVGPSVLVSNTEQGSHVDNDERIDRGQAFTTGRNVSGYNVTGVTIISTDPDGDDIALQICEVGRDGDPTTTCPDLTAPGSSVAGPLTFTVPTNTTRTLSSLTTYMVVFKSPGRESVALGATSSSAEDAASVPNWSMRNRLQIRLSGGWTVYHAARVLRMTIQGTANAASSTGPTAMDSSVAPTEDTPYTFAAADFNFVATTLGDTLASVRIHTLPADGALTLNSVDVTAGQSVTRIQLNAGQLVYRPADNAFGAGYAAFQFVVSGNSEASPFAYWMTIDVSAVNDAATGAPAISGTAQVGQTLTASTTPIADLDGLPGAFNYQWIRVDADGSSNAADIIGADSSMYELTESEEGKKVKVEVSFMDNGGASETRVSAAYPATGTVAAALLPNTPPTASHGAVATDEDTDHTFAAADFSYSDSDRDPLHSVKITGLPAAGKGTLILDGTVIAAGALPKTVTAAELAGEKLTYSPPANAHGRPGQSYASFTFKVNDGREDSADGYDITITVKSVNDAATGGPTISGTAQVGQTLTASNTGIVDPEGFAFVTSRQWIRVDADGMSNPTDIGTNSDMYTLTGNEVGKRVKVEVTFYDTDFNSETVLSAAYPADGTVTPVPGVNTPPTAMDSAVTTSENTNHTFAAAEFSYADIDDDPLASVKITALPAAGTLSLDGTAIASTALPKTVTANQLATSKLKYTPPTDRIGTPSFTFKVNDGMADSAEYTMTINVTAVNSPATVTVSFEADAYTVPEGGTQAVTVRLSADPERTVVIPLTATNQGNASATDYTVPLSVTFNTGELSKTITFTATDDADDDDGESVLLAFGTSLPAGVSASGTVESTVSITDDDDPQVTVSFGAGAYTVPEGGTQAVTVRLSADPERTVVIPLTATNQGNASATDYSVPLSVTFNTGELSKTITFTATQDADDDDGESVLLAFGTSLPAGVSASGTVETVVTITDDDDPQVTVSFGAGAYTVPEGGTQAVTVRLSADPERTVVIPLTATNQGNASPADYSVPLSVTFNTGELSKTVIFTATADTDDDDGESVLLAFDTSLPAGVSASGTVETVVTITDDDDPQVTVSFGAGAYTVPEGGTQAVTVRLSADPERTVVIPLTATNQGSASATDYTVPLSVTFNTGERSKTITFTAAMDMDNDDGESVLLGFDTSLPAGVSASGTVETTVTITDDDDPQVTVSFGAGAYTVPEGATQAVTVRLSADPERTVVVPLTATDQGTTSSTDYSVPLSVTFNTGEMSKTITFTATADVEDDDDESVLLGFDTSLPAGVSASGTVESTVTITDDDDPAVTVSFEVDAYTVPEGATQTVTVTLSADPERTVVVPLTATDQGNASPTDYSVPLSVTFNDGELSKTITFTATQDADDDDGESVLLGFDTSLPAGVSASGTVETTVTITDDDDPQVTVSFGADAYTVPEGGTQAVTVRLSADPERTVVIPLTATNQGTTSSTDYSVPLSVTFNDGELSKTITFTATADVDNDDGESVLLAFGPSLPVGVSASGTVETTVTITDDDVPAVTVSFGADAYTVPEGGTQAVTVRLSADPERTVVIRLMKEYLGGVEPTDYSGVPADVTFNAGDRSKSLTFTASQDTVDDDGESVKLAFDTPPTRVSVGTTATTTVSIDDDDGAGVSVSEAALTIGEGSSGTYTIVLDSQPTADVTVTINDPSGNTDVTAEPANLTFSSSDWSSQKTVTVNAAQDADADNETATVTHTVTSTDTSYNGASASSVIVSVTDDDDVPVTVSFWAAAYTVAEGGTQSVTVTLSADPKRRVVIPVEATHQGDASSADYSVPASVTFNAGDTSKSLTFTALLDAEDDDGESVKLAFGTPLPSGVSAGTTAETTVTITVTTGSPPIILGGGGGGGGGGPSPSVVDFKWTVKHDIAELGGGHDTPSGTWSDGATLWVLENGDGADDAIYAYDLKTGERVEGREFKLDEANRAPRGVWSDRTVLWVSDSGRNHLFAHNLATGERLPERDIAFAERNRAARGIWSGEETMWVLDGGKDSLFAYNLASGELLDEYELASGNGDPHGIWSDGVTVWVSDQGAKRLFAYRLPARPAAPAAEDAERQDLERVIDEEFKELSKASNNNPRGLWSDGGVMYVADESDGKVYTYNMPDAFDARLASLSLSRVDIGEFDPGRIDYEGSVPEGVTETTVKAATVQRRTRVEIDPPDADVRANGHQVSLEDLTEITVTVTSADGNRKKTYRVRLGPAGRAPDCLRGDVAVGFSLVVYAGGSVEDLAACAESRNVTALYTLDDGEYVSYILGAPEFVNEDFRALFADGIPALMPLTVKSDGPATAAPVASAVTGLWAACLQGEIGEGFNLVVYEGGSIDDLVACVEGAGLAAVYTLNDGAWVSHIPGAPDFVNRSFRELFTDGLTVATPLVGKRD